MAEPKTITQLTFTEKDAFWAKDGVFTKRGLEEAFSAKSPKLGEYICKTLILDPAPRQMFIESRRGTSTFDWIHSQISTAVQEQKILLQNKKKASDDSAKISVSDSLQYNWRAHQHVWEHLTSEVMENLLPERVFLSDLILALWNEQSSWAREQLFFVLRFARMKYGPWRAFKTIFKEAEIRMDWEIYSILNDRFSTGNISRDNGPQYICITEQDMATKAAESDILRTQEQKKSSLQEQIDELESKEELSVDESQELEAIKKQIEALQDSIARAYEHRDLEPDVLDWEHFISYTGTDLRSNKYGDVQQNRYGIVDPSSKTIEYLKRRARRTFRTLAKDFPESFASAGCEMLLCAHDSLVQQYIRSRKDLWLNNQLALLKVVEQSASSTNVTWAYNLLKEEYRIAMKEVSADWLYRVSQSKYDFIHQLALDYLQNQTGVGSGEYYQKGYYKTIIGFLGFDRIQHSHEAITFASDYLTMMGANPKNTWLVQELPLPLVARLMRSSRPVLSKLGFHLLEGNDAKSAYEEAFTLDFFSILLGDSKTTDFAQKNIRKRYTGLKPEWYEEQLNSSSAYARSFAQEMLKDSTMVASDVDWSQFCMRLLCTIEAQSGVYEAGWNRLTLLDIHGHKLIDDRTKIPIEFLRFLFVHPSRSVRAHTTYLLENKICTTKDLGAAFLKTIATKREFKEQITKKEPWKGMLGSFVSPLLVEYLQENIDNNIYGDDLGSTIRTWLENEFTLNDLGLDWTYERLQWWAQQYSFVRTIFTRDATLPQISQVLPPLSKEEYVSGNTVIDGARQLAWLVYHRCPDASSPKAKLFSSILLERNPRYRAHKGETPLADDMVWPQETFDFAWFTRWATSKREPIRAFALSLARYEMSHWISSQNIGFRELRIFFTGYFDVQNALVRSIYKPESPVNLSRIDLSLKSFVPKDLYSYCFDLDERVVEFGLRIIADKPTLFGKPEDLLSLSDSNNARVRQLVIQVLWFQYKAPTTTPGWKPFSYSVVPYDPSRAIDPIRQAGIDPNTLSGEDAVFGSNKHFLGLGNKPVTPFENIQLHDDARFDLHEFLRRILFTLPRSPEQKNAEKQARKEQMAHQYGASSAKKQKSLEASWKNKQTLVAAIRDLALYVPSSEIRNAMTAKEHEAFEEDQKDFARFMIPVLEEFVFVRSKMLHNACLTALVQIKNKHFL